MARASRPTSRPGAAKTSAAAKGSLRRARLAFVGAIVASAIVIFAWFPAGSLLSQRSNLQGTESEINALHAQDAALAQENKNLSDSGEIGRIAREQYELVSLRSPAALGRHLHRHPLRRRPGVGRPRDPVGNT